MDVGLVFGTVRLNSTRVVPKVPGSLRLPGRLKLVFLTLYDEVSLRRRDLFTTIMYLNEPLYWKLDT